MVAGFRYGGSYLEWPLRPPCGHPLAEPTVEPSKRSNPRKGHCMRISFFRDLCDTHPQNQDLTWPQFVDRLHKLAKVSDKKTAPCFSPAEYHPRKGRSSRNVLQVHMAVLDIDSITESDLAELSTKLEPYAHAAYTTLSHPVKSKTGLWALRIILPLDKPVDAAAWPTFWSCLQTFCNGVADPQCKDPSRLYILPAQYFADPPPLIDSNEGLALPTAMILATPNTSTSTAPAIPSIGQRIEPERIKMRVRQLDRVPYDPKKVALAANLRALIQGKPYGDPGRRHSTMLALTTELDRLFPSVAAEHIADLFEASHLAMTEVDPEPPEPLAAVAAAIEGARQNRIAWREEKDAEHTNSRALRIADARGDGHPHPYTAEELDHIATRQNIPRSMLDQHWIIRHSGMAFFLGLQGYSRGFPLVGVVPTISHQLAPVPNLQLYQVDGRGAQATANFRTFDAIFADYGTDAYDISLDLRVDYGHYDRKTQHLRLAAGKRAPLEPKEHPQIHEWLTLLGGDKAEKFLDWIALVPAREKKLCAVYLNGAQGVGKTVFAHGLSKIWRRSTPTSFLTAVRRFNLDLAACPLILVDEGFPALPPKQLAQELRLMVGGDEIRIEQKFGGSYPLVGPRRLIMCGNNASLLDFKTELSHDDIEALAVRIMQVRPSLRARQVIGSVDEATFRTWQSYAIAEHVLYLHETRVVQPVPGARFAVQGEVDDSIRQVLVDGHYPSLACQVIVSYITDTRRKAQRDDMIKCGRGEVLVNQEGLYTAWHEILPKGPQPPVRLNGVLRALSKIGSRNVKTAGMVRKFWSIDLDILSTWCDANGYTSDEIRKLINAPVDASILSAGQ